MEKKTASWRPGDDKKKSLPLVEQQQLLAYLKERYPIEKELAKSVRKIEGCIEELERLTEGRIADVRMRNLDLDVEALAEAEITMARSGHWSNLEDLKLALKSRRRVDSVKVGVDNVLSIGLSLVQIADLLGTEDLETLKDQRRKHPLTND